MQAVQTPSADAPVDFFFAPAPLQELAPSQDAVLPASQVR
jgi:hypothetical protein